MLQQSGQCRMSLGKTTWEKKIGEAELGRGAHSLHAKPTVLTPDGSSRVKMVIGGATSGRNEQVLCCHFAGYWLELLQKDHDLALEPEHWLGISQMLSVTHICSQWGSEHFLEGVSEGHIFISAWIVWSHSIWGNVFTQVCILSL